MNSLLLQAAASQAFRDLNNAPLGPGVWICLGLYIGALLLACVFALLRNRGTFARFGKDAEIVADGEEVNHHYTAGGSLGYFVMPLTIFATFFSGVTLVGVPSEASAFGFYALRWLWAGLGMLFGWTLFAPRLRRLSELRGGYMSAVDVASDRFRDVELRVVLALVQIFAAFLYLVAQFVSIGATINSMSGGAIPKWAAAMALAIVMLIYESIGGMQMVAWTDAIQGLMLLIGFLFLFIIQTTELGGVPNAVATLAAEEFNGSLDAEFHNADRVEVPTLQQMGNQVPFLVGFIPFVLYGHMQHRVFAAQSEKSLRYALTFMALIVMVIFTGATLLGVTGRAYFLENNIFIDEANRVPPPRADTFGTVMRVLLLSNGENHINYAFGSLILSAGVAALMSTADSALLSMSCVVSLDIVKAFFARAASPRAVVWVGRAVSVVASIVGVAVAITEPVINDLITIQQQFLLQISPAMLCAMYKKEVRSRALTAGAVAGMVVNVAIVLGSPDTNIQQFAGFFGLCANLPITVGLHYVDHPFFQRVNNGDPAQWERFGKPMPDKLIGYKIEGFEPELIHNPFWKVLATIFVLGFLLGIPWFYTPSTLNVIGTGLPSWVVQYLIIFPFLHLGMAYIMYNGWKDNKPQDEDVKDIESDDSEVDIKKEDSLGDAVVDKQASEDSEGSLAEDSIMPDDAVAPAKETEMAPVVSTEA